MLSALYAFQLSPALDLEASLQQMTLPVNAQRAGFRFTALSSATTFDITAFFTPFAFSQRLRLGVGASARWQQSGVVAMSFSLDSLGQTVERETVNFQNTFAVGATVKIEYRIPATEILDIALRAQAHIFAPPIIGWNFHVPANMPGGAASVGVFTLFRL